MWAGVYKAESAGEWKPRTVVWRNYNTKNCNFSKQQVWKTRLLYIYIKTKNKSTDQAAAATDKIHSCIEANSPYKFYFETIIKSLSYLHYFCNGVGFL